MKSLGFEKISNSLHDIGQGEVVIKVYLGSLMHSVLVEELRNVMVLIICEDSCHKNIITSNLCIG